MVGQIAAREGAGIVVALVRSGKFAGRTVLIAGPPGTGKTAIAIGIAKELGRDVPFVPIAASEIYSTEIKKTEFLTQALRKAIGVRIHEMRNIYEGVVRGLEIEKQAHPYNPYQQVPVSATIELATDKDRKKISVDQTFAMQLVQQGVESGDVIQIDVDGGRVVKLGKSPEAIKERKLDLTAEESVPIPTGDVQKEKEFVYTLTLHQMDTVQSRRSMGGDIFSLFFGGGERREMDSELRRAIDESVRKMVEEGKAEILPGVVFIDECSMLDIETFAFLNRAMEQDLAPIIIFATNRGITDIRGTTIRSPHGMPIDLLDRLLIINTQDYKPDEIRQIIQIRASAEKIEFDEKSLEMLVEIGSKTSLRYAIQLLAPASELAKGKIKPEHIKKAKKLFADVKRSVSYLREYEKRMLE